MGDPGVSDSPRSPRSGCAPAAEPMRSVTVGDLMGDARQLGILHEDRRYVLRLTRQNKLILTRDERADPTPEQQR